MQCAEDLKAKPGTGDNQPCWLAESDNPAKEGSVQNHKRALVVKRTGFR